MTTNDPRLTQPIEQALPPNVFLRIDASGGPGSGEYTWLVADPATKVALCRKWLLLPERVWTINELRGLQWGVPLTLAAVEAAFTPRDLLELARWVKRPLEE